MVETFETKLETLDEMSNEGEETKPDTLNSSSSDSESESDAEEDHRLEILEKELAENSSNYDAHVQYIKSLRKLGQIDKLRHARESMSAIFPLSPEMWQEWAKDEASLSTGNEAFAAIEKLYERGVHDYLSVSLWCDYLHFVQEHDISVRERSSAGISKIRDLFERALTAAGLHVVEGKKIWEAYLEFEQTIFHSIDDNGSQEKEKQVQRIRSVFHRQLSVPLADLRSTLLVYKAWEVERGSIPEISSSDFDGIPSNVVSAYQKAMEMYNARVHHEEQISGKDASDTERFQHFMTYIKFEESFGDPARVQNLFERAVTEFPVSSELWLDYTRYLDQTLKVPKVAMSVYSRATKSCTWIGELWVRYLLSLERARVSEEVLSAVFEQSLKCSFSTFEEYLDLFLTRIDGLRRRFSLACSTEDVLDYGVIRDTFQHATDYLSPHMKNTDGLLHLHAYWARLELNLGKDLVAARGVWESLLKTSGSMLEVWKRYIAMEVEMGHIDEARCIYKRCYSKRFIGTGSEDICHSWLRFEREFGTMEDYDLAIRKVTPRLEELRLFRLQQESKSVAPSVAQKEDPPAKKSSHKRKTGTRLNEQPTPKRQKGTAHNPTGMVEKDTVQNSAEERNVGQAEPKDNKPEAINEQQSKHSASREFYTDQCTLFISNLSLQAKDEHLRDFFSDIGGVTAIRLLRDKFTGKSRGLAYVDFSDEAHLASAIAKNRQILLGKKLSIARSEPKKRESFGRSTREHGKTGPTRNIGSAGEGSDSRESVGEHSVAAQARGDHVQLKGKNTFAVPRNLVRPLGWTKNEPKNEETVDKPKSNDEFRNMLLKR